MLYSWLSTIRVDRRISIFISNRIYADSLVSDSTLRPPRGTASPCAGPCRPAPRLGCVPGFNGPPIRSVSHPPRPVFDSALQKTRWSPISPEYTVLLYCNFGIASITLTNSQHIVHVYLSFERRPLSPTQRRAAPLPHSWDKRCSPRPAGYDKARERANAPGQSGQTDFPVRISSSTGSCWRSAPRSRRWAWSAAARGRGR